MNLQTYVEHLERLRPESRDERQRNVITALFAHGRTLSLRYGVET